LKPTNIILNQNSSPYSPIPVPSYPKQYRAIGVIRGKYQPSANAMTKGFITTLSETNIEAVLLGKTISAVKNHVNFNQNHHWIVYPHSTFQEENPLHLQIAGIWQPNSQDDSNQLTFAEDYFSIRGEVIYSSKQEEKVIVKIYFNDSIEDNQGNFFKLQLNGKIPDHTIKHFYNFNVILEKDQLVIKQYTDLGLIAIRYSDTSSGRKRDFRKKYDNT
jgi:hypothetical protein